MKQILKKPLNVQVQKEEVNVLLDNEISQAFWKAHKELTQQKGSLGSIEDKIVCAAGVIFYYFVKPDISGNNVMYPCNLPTRIFDQLSEFDNYLLKNHGTVMTSLNDEHNWKFTDFAREAEKWEANK